MNLAKDVMITHHSIHLENYGSTHCNLEWKYAGVRKIVFHTSILGRNGKKG